MTDHICSDHLNCFLGHPPSIIRMLHELGHFADVDEDGFALGGPTYDEVCDLSPTATAVRKAVKSWQSFRPLRIDGEFGERSHAMSVQELGCRCGCPDVMHRRASIAEWPEDCQRNITTGHNLSSLRINFPDGRDIDDAWRHSIHAWNAVCGIVLSHVGYDTNPKISAKPGRMGSGVLAWSYLPVGDCSEHLRQEYNQALTWDWNKSIGVKIHELGHAIGLPHTSQPGNIMQPYYDPNVITLGPWEIAQVIKRYGKPADVPTPDPPTPDPPGPGPRILVEGGIVELVFADGHRQEMDLWPRAQSPK